jgi:iron complex transport system ATP-binding protein
MMLMRTSPTPSGLHARAVDLRAGAKTLLHDVSLDLQPGEVGALLGPNGAGKSTLLSVIAGLKQPSGGEILIDGERLHSHRLPLPQLAQRRAFLPQDTLVAFDFTAREVVELGRYPHRSNPSRHEADIVPAAMRMTDSGHLADQRLAWLSGGERLRVQLARVLAQIWEPRPDGQSRWLFLDEPTSALDLQHQHGVLDTIRHFAKQQCIGILMVLHDLNLALRYTDRVWVLEQGRLIAAGPVQEVLNGNMLAAVWNVQSKEVRDATGIPQILSTGKLR